MPLTLQLKPEVEARLLARAARQGISVEAMVGNVIEKFIVSPIEVEAEISPQEKALAFVAWARSHTLKAPPLPDEAISRESLYLREDEYNEWPG